MLLVLLGWTDNGDLSISGDEILDGFRIEERGHLVIVFVSPATEGVQCTDRLPYRLNKLLFQNRLSPRPRFSTFRRPAAHALEPHFLFGGGRPLEVPMRHRVPTYVSYDMSSATTPPTAKEYNPSVLAVYGVCIFY